MIELIAYEQKSSLATDVVGDQWTLDITQPGGVSLSYQVSKGNDVMGRYSPFSQTFRLPFTNHNSRFFGLYYDVNLTGASLVFDIHKKTYCEIRVDGVPIITGSLQLKNIHTKSEEYEVAVFGEEANLFQEIQDRKLIDLFINDAGAMDVDYDVTLSGVNIINSWDDTEDVTNGNVGNGIIMFPLADYGLAGENSYIYYGNNNLTTAGLGSDNFLEPYMLKPAINIAHLFEKVITEAGYSLTASSFLSSDAWTKLYMTLASDRESVATRGVLGLSVGRDYTDPIGTTGFFGQITASGSGTSLYSQEMLIRLNKDSGVGFLNNPPAMFDVEDNWDTANYWFTAPDTGTYYGTLYLSYRSLLNTSGGSSGGGTIKYGVKKLGEFGQSNWQVMVASIQNSQSTTIPVAPVHFAYELQAGEKLIAFYQATFTNTSGNFIKLATSGTYLTIHASQLANGIAQMPNNMPDIQQGAFVKDLCERFNLCVVADADDAKKLIIQPWQDYLNLGDRKDWTDRLDTSKEFTIKSTDSIRKKFIKFSDAEDDTLQNANFEEANNYVIGEYRQEVGHDFTSGTLSNSPVFAPYQVSVIPNQNWTDVSEIGNVLIHKGYGSDINGPISSAKPKLFYYNGLADIDSGYNIKVGTATTIDYKYGLCLPFYNDGDPIDADSPLALWKWQPTNSFSHPVYGSTPSGEGYFARYHQQFLMSIYGNEARLVECQIMLSPTDIFNFRFNDEIIIRNTAYRVLKIGNYQPFANVPCKLTLLKKLDAFHGQNLPQPEQDCALIVTGFQQNGNVVFTDPTDGTTSSGTEVCCNENGYNWNTTQNACMWNIGPTGTGNGLNDGVLPGTPYSEGKSLVTNLGGIHALKTTTTKNNNPIIGEVSIQGIINSTGIPTTQKNVVFYATSYSDTAATATPTGDDAQSGYLNLPPGMMARMVIRSLSVQTDNYSATSSVGSQGSTSFKVYTFMAKNIDGVITVTGSEQTDFAQEDGDAGTRTVAVAGTKGTGGFADISKGLIISVTASAQTVVNWNLDCSITFMDITTQSIGYDDHLLLESMGYILAETGQPLGQE